MSPGQLESVSSLLKPMIASLTVRRRKALSGPSRFNSKAKQVDYPLLVSINLQTPAMMCVFTASSMSQRKHVLPNSPDFRRRSDNSNFQAHNPRSIHQPTYPPQTVSLHLTLPSQSETSTSQPSSTSFKVATLPTPTQSPPPQSADSTPPHQTPHQPTDFSSSTAH